DHGELSRGEREQHAEAEQAREKEHRMLQRRRDHKPGDRDQRGRDDGLWGYQRPRIEPAELAWQLSVLAEGVREPSETRDGRRRRGEQDQRSRKADEHLQRRADRTRNVLADLRDDAHQRRAKPRSAELSSVLGRERGERDEGDRHVQQYDEAAGAEQAARKIAAGPARLL